MPPFGGQSFEKAKSGKSVWDWITSGTRHWKNRGADLCDLMLLCQSSLKHKACGIKRGYKRLESRIIPEASGSCKTNKARVLYCKCRWILCCWVWMLLGESANKEILIIISFIIGWLCIICEHLPHCLFIYFLLFILKFWSGLLCSYPMTFLGGGGGERNILCYSMTQSFKLILHALNIIIIILRAQS